jgi:alkylhydroperoxidase family enzyme
MLALLPPEEARRLGKEAGIDDELVNVNAFRALINNPTAAAAVHRLLTTLMFRNQLPSRTRELVILRTGWRTRSEYEFCQHVRVSRNLKLSEAEILGVRDPERCAAYSEVDRAVIRMADELHERAEVSPATWAVLEKAFTPNQLVELLLASGFWRMIAGFLKTAKVPLDADVPGWPEAKAPA